VDGYTVFESSGSHFAREKKENPDSRGQRHLSTYFQPYKGKGGGEKGGRNTRNLLLSRAGSRKEGQGAPRLHLLSDREEQEKKKDDELS